MLGNDDDNDDGEVFGPVPHPDDRIWRHPAEMAAMAARADADTVEVLVANPANQHPQRPRRLYRNVAVATGLAVAGAAALAVGIMSAGSGGSTTGLATGPAAPIAAPDVVNSRNTTIPIYNAAEDQLTNQVYEQTADALPRVQAAMASGINEGSGLFITESGHIATSAALVAEADYVLVWTHDGQRWNADVLASDPISDIAVLQIDSTEWPAAALGSDTPVHPGQRGLAIDHQRDTVSIGTITATYGSYIEVDQPAAVPGSAILNDAGAVIAVVTGDGSNRYAKPAWLVERVSVDLLADGVATHTTLGVVVENDGTRDGMIEVIEVVAGSPAAKAGLQPGDLIDSLDSMPINDAAELVRTVQTNAPGDEVVLTVTRHGNRRIVIAYLGELLPPQ